MSNRLGGFIAGQNINVSIGTFTAVTSPTFTFASTQATPAVGQAVQFTTTGTLPTGLSLNTTYYVISTSTNTCQFSTTQSGSAVTFTNSSGSGTHTAVTQRAFNPYAGAPDTVEYLVVAGGGGGGDNSPSSTDTSGAGGAGGLLTAAGFNVASGTALTITVGSGGARGSASAGSDGTSSVFSSISTTGGGGGANGFPGGGTSAGRAGGSGGGGGKGAGAGGTGVSGQGFAGGPGNAANTQGGGGGGAGSVGLAGQNGTGLCSTITGARVFYAVGGAPYSQIQTANVNGQNGTGNGGSGSNVNTQAGGGNGGSGIVIVRYPQVNSAPAMVTGSPQVSYADGYQIYTWTSSGSIIF